MRAEQALACGMRKRKQKASFLATRFIAVYLPPIAATSPARPRTPLPKALRLDAFCLSSFSHQAGGLDKNFILHPIPLLSAQPHQLIHDTERHHER
jgi:hypothetical protein